MGIYMPKKQYLQVGRIVGTHGMRGEVRVQPWCDSPQVMEKLDTLYYDEGNTAINVKCRAHKNIVLVKIDSVDTLQDAAALRGRILYLHRDDLELDQGRYFIQDLIGLRVIDADNLSEYGILSDVSSTGANDVYHIDTPQGEFLIPAIPSIVIKFDINSGTISIRPIKGMFDNEI